MEPKTMFFDGNIKNYRNVSETYHIVLNHGFSVKKWLARWKKEKLSETSLVSLADCKTFFQTKTSKVKIFLVLNSVGCVVTANVEGKRTNVLEKSRNKLFLRLVNNIIDNFLKNASVLTTKSTNIFFRTGVNFSSSYKTSSWSGAKIT